LSRPILHLFPQVRLAQRRFHQILGIGLTHPLAVQSFAGKHVVGNRHRRKWIRPLEDHPHLSSDRNGVDSWPIEVFAIEEYRSLDTPSPNHLVHPVQRPDES
jgi:hypothetical protein